MKSKKPLLPLFIALVFVISSFIDRNNGSNVAIDKWSGTITYNRSSKNAGFSNENGVKHEWNINFEYKVNATFTNNKGTAERSDYSLTMNRHTSKFTPDKDHVEERNTEINCASNGDVEVNVEIDRENKTYWISFSPPFCQESVKHLIYPIYTHQPIQVAPMKTPDQK